jgi:hypothetical protein
VVAVPFAAVGVAVTCMEGLYDSNAGLGAGTKKKSVRRRGKEWSLINYGLVASQLARLVRLD